MKRIVSSVMLVLILISMLMLAFSIQLVTEGPIALALNDNGEADFTVREVANDGRLIGAYYFVWWGMAVNSHWPLGYKYSPFLGEYNSADPKVADQHIKWAVKHGIDFFAVAWYGSHQWADYPYIDQSLRSGLLRASYLPSIKFCIFYDSGPIMDTAERLGANKTQAFIEDMLYVASNYFNNTSYLRIDGKPVVILNALYYLYYKLGYTTVPFEFVRQKLATMNMSIYFVGDAVTPSTPDVNSPLLRSMDAVTSWYFGGFTEDWQKVLDNVESYYPQWLSAMNSIGVNFIPNVYPGFDDTAFIYGESRVLLRNQSIFRKMFDAACKYLDPQIKTLIITSWNEWHESTSIEPAIEWGETYLEKLHTITVPDDYATIQEAINAAFDGDTIYVRAGTYYEHVVLNKTVSLLGENKMTTVINGNGSGTVVTIISDNSIVDEFTIKNGSIGILAVNARNNTISNNLLINNTYAGIELTDYSSRNILKDNNITDNGYGILFNDIGGNNTILKNVISNSQYDGMQIFSDKNFVAKNTITNTGWNGIYLQSSNENTINENSLLNIWDTGLVLFKSNNNTVERNTLSDLSTGIRLSHSAGNVLSNNTITSINRWKNWMGTVFENSTSTVFIGNLVMKNTYGIRLIGSDSNFLYHNNFINNTYQVWSSASVNTWDDGYPSGGNYWSDYTGLDEYSGPYQNETGSDGIGDIPYVIDEYNQDRYPLMKPWAPVPQCFELTITSTPITGIAFTINGTAQTTPHIETLLEGIYIIEMPEIHDGYVWSHWFEDEDTNRTKVIALNQNATWTAVYSPVPPLSVSISPATAEIKIGESCAFTSSVSGGIMPYSYQWYLNGSAVSEAQNPTWIFTPTTTETYKVYLMVTDSLNNTAKSNEATVTVAPQLAVSISPMSASILVGQSVTFTSTVSGGYPPYNYQWFLNGNPVSGVTSNTWTFTPTTGGIYYVYLKVTDSKGNTAQSETARITVATVPVGGYSIPIKTSTTAKQVIPYTAMLTILTATFIVIKRKTKRKQ